jgi:hypothetical protein
MMTPREIDKLVEGYIGTNNGYLNHFSYSLHDSFYYRYCDLTIDVAAYRNRAGTTRRAFILILQEAKPRDQAKIIRGVFEMISPTDAKEVLQKELLEVASRLEADGEIETPQIALTSQTVLEALRDSETLLKERGATSAVDRAHTALHGYIKKLCSDRGLAMPADPSLTVLFKIIREQFPEFSATIPHDTEAKRVFGSLATALDSLNTIRNRGTLAHPNELLLKESEAMLYINLSRAVLAYIDSKARK